MDTIIALIIAIVAVIVIIFLNTFFMYLPIQRISEQVGTTTKGIDFLTSTVEKDLLPIVEKGANDFITLINRGLSLETKIDGIIIKSECAICKFASSPLLGLDICDGDVLKPLSEICPKTQ